MNRIRRWRRATALSAAGLGLMMSGLALAADHGDSPSVEAEPAADITDVFAWMSSDASTLNLAMSVPAAMFSDATQYVFHINSSASYGAAATETTIICTFDAGQSVQCWAGDDEYVAGDASGSAGITSESGALKVFTGSRNDPFYFNFGGFSAVLAAVKAAAGGLTFDTAGCPDVDSATSTLLVTTLGEDGSGNAAVDDFAGGTVSSLVIQVDKTVVNSGGPILGVWGATRN